MTNVTEIEPLEVTLSGEDRFVNPLVAASYLGEVLEEKYGSEWLDWEPETLWQMIKRDFVSDVHPVNKDKIGAVKTLLLVDDYWEQWNIFEKVTKAFNNQIPSFLMTEGCSPGEMAWSVEDSSRIRTDVFTDEVSAYVRSNCLDNGYVVFPGQLAFAQNGITSESEKAVYSAMIENGGDTEAELPDNMIGVQVAKLNAVGFYVDNMKSISDSIANSEGDN